MLINPNNTISPDTRPRLPPFFDSLLKIYTSPDDYKKPTPHVHAFGDLLYQELARISASPIFFKDKNIPNESHPCISPVIIRHGTISQRYPCGRCLLCRQSRTINWFTKMRLESLDSNSYFITLTYSEEYVTILNRRDYQNFIKRIRHYLPHISYVIQGEYGPQTGRPHYHLLLFDKDRHPESYVKDVIRQAWHYGAIDFKTPTDNHLYYIAGYTKDNFVIHESFRNFSLKHPIGRSTPKARDAIAAFHESNTPIESMSGPLYSPLHTTRDLLRADIISQDTADIRTSEFLSTVDQSAPINTTYSIRFLHNYIDRYRETYNRFIIAKL